MAEPQSQTSFFENVWLSIFTPGTTPTLLIATNATFAALQLILALLLFFTYSVHFLILSIITGALWWSINWFAAEVAVVQREQEEKKQREDTGSSTEGRSRARRTRSAAIISGEGIDGGGMDSGDDTETEAEGLTASRSGMTSDADASEASDGRASPLIPTSVGETQSVAGRDEGAIFNTGAAARLAPNVADGEGARKRRSLADSTVSTDSEWEKVDDEMK